MVSPAAQEETRVFPYSRAHCRYIVVLRRIILRFNSQIVFTLPCAAHLPPRGLSPMAPTPTQVDTWMRRPILRTLLITISTCRVLLLTVCGYRNTVIKYSYTYGILQMSHAEMRIILSAPSFTSPR